MLRSPAQIADLSQTWQTATGSKVADKEALSSRTQSGFRQLADIYGIYTGVSVYSLYISLALDKAEKILELVQRTEHLVFGLEWFLNKFQKLTHKS